MGAIVRQQEKLSQASSHKLLPIRLIEFGAEFVGLIIGLAMASLVIQTVMAGPGVGAGAGAGAVISGPISSAGGGGGDGRHAGFVAISCVSDGRRSLRRLQDGLASSRGLFVCNEAFPGACTPRAGRRPRQQGAVCMVLPTGNPIKEGQGSGPQGHPAWSARAIKSYSMSELEARKLKYPTTGTEALLMGMLTEGTSHAARFLRANGVTLFGVRDQTIKILGKADMYFFSPEHPPLTEQAQKALDWAIEEKAKRGGDDEVTTSFMLLGIWAQKGSAGQKVLEALGFDDKKAEDLLASERKPVAVS